jgi:hypothetical protein
MKTFLTSVLAVVAAAFIGCGLAACGKQDVSFDTLETARATAKANAEYNALGFRAASPQYANYALEMQGDSSQTPACPQGDGWASGKLVDKTNPAVKVAIKCSTVSGSVGCLLQSDFATKPYAADDGACQPVSKVPFPLPKIAK